MTSFLRGDLLDSFEADIVLRENRQSSSVMEALASEYLFRMTELFLVQLVLFALSMSTTPVSPIFESAIDSATERFASLTLRYTTAYSLSTLPFSKVSAGVWLRYGADIELAEPSIRSKLTSILSAPQTLPELEGWIAYQIQQLRVESLASFQQREDRVFSLLMILLEHLRSLRRQCSS